MVNPFYTEKAFVTINPEKKGLDAL